MTRTLILTRISAFVFAFGFALTATAQAPGGDSDGLRINVNVSPAPAAMDVAQPFYDELAPYGQWHYSDEYGYMWKPYEANANWRPYTRGSWAYTDDGWYWVSSETWGDAPFHYGRWHHHPRRGWVWLPGRVWGPAWVVWRSGPGYLGWAPLPPEAYYDRTTGITWSVSMDRAIYADGWVFVDDRYVMDPYVYGYIYPPYRNGVFFRSTTVYHPGYSYRQGRVYGGGVPIDRVQRATGRRIEARTLDRSRARPRVYDERSRVRGRDDDARVRSRDDDVRGRSRDDDVRGRSRDDDARVRSRDDDRSRVRSRDDDKRGRQNAPSRTAPTRDAPSRTRPKR